MFDMIQGTQIYFYRVDLDKSEYTKGVWAYRCMWQVPAVGEYIKFRNGDLCEVKSVTWDVNEHPHKAHVNVEKVGEK